MAPAVQIDTIKHHKSFIKEKGGHLLSRVMVWIMSSSCKRRLQAVKISAEKIVMQEEEVVVLVVVEKWYTTVVHYPQRAR